VRVAHVKLASADGRSQMARHVLGADWLSEYAERANHGGIERVLV
jgi:uncharacterized protein DUF3400